MEETTKQKMLLATISQCVSERDKANFAIASILENGFSTSHDNVGALKSAFERLTLAELTIENIQVYYAKNFKPNLTQTGEIKEEKQ